MNLSEQKVVVRCAIQRVLRAGVRDQREDRGRASKEIRDIITTASIPVISGPFVTYLPDYNGFGPMWYGEVGVLIYGQPQTIDLMARSS